MIYLSTQKGINKAESEDAVLVGTEVLSETAITLPLPQKGFICVADGVGGHNGGRVASHFILEYLRDHSDIENIRSSISEANMQLLEIAKKSPGLESMATTLSGIYISEENQSIFHVGNTRVYSRQGSYLKQLTADHTVCNWLKCMGRLEEATACNKNEITACLGGGSDSLMKPLVVGTLGNWGTLLLTSDGIHDYVSIDFLEDILTSDMDNQLKCEAIIEEAKASGSLDDLTVVLLCKEV